MLLWKWKILMLGCFQCGASDWPLCPPLRLFQSLLEIRRAVEPTEMQHYVLGYLYAAISAEDSQRSLKLFTEVGALEDPPITR